MRDRVDWTTRGGLVARYIRLAQAGDAALKKPADALRQRVGIALGLLNQRRSRS